MKPTFFILQQLGLAFLLTVVAFPAACAPGNKTKIVKWQEEVKLSTGEVIVVERETRFRPANTGRPKDSGWAAHMMTIRFHYPPDSKEVIEWRTVRHDAELRYSPETPLVLDVDAHRHALYVITRAGGTTGDCDEYWRYRYENGVWRDDMLPETFETRASNLWLGSKEIDTSAKITLDYKRKFEADYHRWTRYDIRFQKVGPDRCLCGHIGNPNKGGCVQKYNTNKE